MTKYTRLTSETSLIDYIRGLERKIDAQATKGSGDIIVADESGVETVIGTLPDGSVGFEQFVGDTTPPPVATMPAVSAQPGTFVVSWDGTFEGGATKPRDFVHVNVIGHKMDGSTTVFSAPLGVIRLVTESVLVNLDVAAGGESWQFSLESEDYSGNKAQWSARTPSYMMLDAISTTDQAWTDLNDEVAGKGRTFTQSVAPPVQERLAQNLWIDTSLGVNLSVTKFWDSTANSGAGAWVPVKDQEINAAETRAAQDAKNKADAAAIAAINAQAYTTNPSFDDWTGSAPTGYANYNVGPTKEATIFKRGPYAARFNCTDTTTNRGLSFAGIFSSAPDIEYWTVQVTFQLVSGTTLSGAGVRLDWEGQTVPAGTQPTLQLINEVPSPITGKWYTVTKTLRKPANATGTYTGMSGYLFANYNSNGLGVLSVKDIIFDWLDIRPASVSEILAYTAPTTQYVDQAKQSAIDAAAVDAQTKATQAKNDAINDTVVKLQGKNKIVWSTSPATGTSGYVAGDVWFQRDANGATIGQWEFTTSWQPRTISDAIFGNISANKILGGIIDASVIGSNTITAEKLFIGDFTNYIVNGFGDLGAGIGWGSGLIYDTTDVPTGVTGAFKSTAGQGTYGPPYTYFAVDPSTEYTTDIWIKADKPNSRIYIELRDQLGNQSTSNTIMDTGASQGGYPLSNYVVPTVWTKVTIKTVTSATTTRLRVGGIYFNHSNGSERTATVSLALSMRRRLGGSLLVDGAIDGKVITGATVQSSGTANRGIKFTDTEFAGYDGSGNKNFSLTSSGTLTLKGSLQSGSTIAGATITGALETTATASRGVKLSNTGINAYDASGNLTFSVDAATGIVDAPGIRTNSLSGDKIIAKSMTLDKLVLTSTDNLVMEGDFSNLGASWQTSANLTINSTAGRGSLPAMRLTGTTSTATSLNFNDRALNIKNKIAIDSGDRFHGSMWVKSTATAVAGSYKIVGRFYTTATAYTDITIASSPALAANTWTNVEAIVPNTIPSGTIAAEWYLSLKNAATGTITDVDFVSVTKASTGALIVDGAIDGKVITGATIQTAPSGARIVLDSSTLNAWNTAGDNYFSMSNEEGVNISSKGKAGYSLQRTNFCTNPSFTADTSGWVTTQTGVRDTSVYYSSPASMKLTHTATADRSVYRIEDNSFWSNVRFSIYVRHNAATAKTVTAKFYYTDGNGANLATYSGTATSVAANTWTRISVTTTASAPGGSAGTKLEVVGTGFTSTETLWIDGALYEQSMTALPALGAYFDGDNASTATLTYAWDGTANLSKSYEQTYNDIRIKSGGNNVLVPNVTASNLAPGIGFISPSNPLQQTAGLFSSDGRVVSLIEGASDPQLSRIDVGNGKVLIKSSGDMDIDAGGVINISPNMAGYVSINANLQVSSFMGLSVDRTATSLALTNGWTHFGGGYGNCQIREVMPGVVAIQGMVRPGTKTDGVVISVIPAQFRPNRLQNVGITVRTNQAAPNTDNVGLLSINPNGNVSLYANNMAYVSYATLTLIYFLDSP